VSKSNYHRLNVLSSQLVNELSAVNSRSRPPLMGHAGENPAGTTKRADDCGPRD